MGHWIYKDSKKFCWWIDMLFEVNYSDSKMLIGNSLYNVKRGQSTLSLRSWAIKFNTGTKAVSYFFDLLQKDGMIEKKTIGKGKQSTTLITIINYDKFQSIEETPKKRQTRHKEPHKELHEGHTLEESKEFKEGKESNTIPPFEIFSEYAEAKKPKVCLTALKLKYDTWVELDWHTGKGDKILNWKAVLLNTLKYIDDRKIVYKNPTAGNI